MTRVPTFDFWGGEVLCSTELHLLQPHPPVYLRIWPLHSLPVTLPEWRSTPPLSLDTRNISFPPLSTLLCGSFSRGSFQVILNLPLNISSSCPRRRVSEETREEVPNLQGLSIWQGVLSSLLRKIPHLSLHQLVLKTKKTTREARTRLQENFTLFQRHPFYLPRKCPSLPTSSVKSRTWRRNVSCLLRRFKKLF